MSARDVAEVIQEVFDPELAVDIVSLGLIYGIHDEPGHVIVEMTTTTSGCPMSAAIMDAVGQVVSWLRPDAHVEIVTVSDPPWDPAMMTPDARAWLGLPRTIAS
jgi:metal-sulfur cluster biosynthetic enzyme